MTLSQYIPAFISLPLAAVAMITVAVHLLVVERRTRNFTRRRIRLANGWLMLFSIPLVAAGFSFIDPNTRPRMFMIVWLSVLGLVLMSIALAVADMINTMIAARHAATELRAARHALHRTIDTHVTPPAPTESHDAE